jgi:hypothetical protein
MLDCEGESASRVCFVSSGIFSTTERTIKSSFMTKQQKGGAYSSIGTTLLPNDKRLNLLLVPLVSFFANRHHGKTCSLDRMQLSR